MSENKLTYSDVKDYERLFTLTPPFLLERFAKKNTNLVSKFKSRVDNYLGKLSDNQRNKLDILLETDVDELQTLMGEAYEISNRKQYRILANPKYKQFIELNLDEIRKMI